MEISKLKEYSDLHERYMNLNADTFNLMDMIPKNLLRMYGMPPGQAQV
jgi:hypothetical protein